MIAPSFSDIFSGNAFKNGILTDGAAPGRRSTALWMWRATQPITVDLETQTVTTPFQDRFVFAIDPFRRECLLERP